MRLEARPCAPTPLTPIRTSAQPSDSSFSNMLLAGDWTLNGVNAGCAESAITSGMLASRALVGEPRDETFADYFFQFGEPTPLAA